MANEVAAPAAVVEPPLRMSFEEWLDWSLEREIRSEWIDGEVRVDVRTTLLHGLFVGFVLRLLADYVEFRRLGVVVAEAVPMRLATSGRVPDIIFVRGEHRDRLSNRRLQGAADLVVEVISAERVERDTSIKPAEYAAAGVPEFWLLDARPDRRTARFFHLADGSYREVHPDPDGRYRSSTLPGFWFRPDWLRQDPLPNALNCLAEIAPGAIRGALAGPDDSGADSR
jgi:Uma2 family endonuclease